MRIARRSDLIALVPRSCLGNGFVDEYPGTGGFEAFDLPVSVPEFTISAMWHPRMDADAGHRWMRETVMSIC